MTTFGTTSLILSRHQGIIDASSFRPIIRSGAALVFTTLLGYGQQKTVLRFETDVLPIVQAKCLSCHSSKIRQAGLSLETRDDLLTGGKTGAAVVPGRAEESLLVGMVSTGKCRLAENLSRRTKHLRYGTGSTAAL